MQKNIFLFQIVILVLCFHCSFSSEIKIPDVSTWWDKFLKKGKL